MALSDSILLQISQKKTTYNDILSRMIPNYSTVGSAKAALSRALKNLIAFGEITKKDNFYFLTYKGKNTVESKLKNKILININDLLNKTKKSRGLLYVDDIVKNLQIFIERSKSDPSLLKIGKTSSTFYVSDLEDIRSQINTRVLHYKHLLEVLDRQINILQDQDFEDILYFNIEKNVFEKIKKLTNYFKISEISIECQKEYPLTKNLFINNKHFIKKSENIYNLETKYLYVLKNILLKNFEDSMQANFKIYINEVLVNFSFGKVYFLGPYKVILKIKGE